MGEYESHINAIKDLEETVKGTIRRNLDYGNKSQSVVAQHSGIVVVISVNDTERAVDTSVEFGGRSVEKTLTYSSIEIEDIVQLMGLVIGESMNEICFYINETTNGTNSK